MSLKFHGSSCFRQRLICATLTGKIITIEKIHENDEKPGLRDYELCFLRLLEKLTKGTIIKINKTGTALKYKPGVLVGGPYLGAFDCCLSRGIGYYLEAILCLAPFGKQPTTITLRGITNHPKDISVDMFRNTTLYYAEKFGIEGCTLQVVKRGAFPDGGGEVVFNCPMVKQLKPVQILDEGMIKKIRGIAYSTRVSTDIANRVVESARGVFNHFIPDVWIYTDHYTGKNSGNCPGYAIYVQAETDTGCRISQEHVAKAGSNPEDIGTHGAKLLLEEIKRGGCVDSSTQWLILLFMTLTPEDVSKVRFGKLTEYSIQLLRNIKTFFAVQFKIKPDYETHTLEGTAFNAKEREALKITALLPSKEENLMEQIQRLKCQYDLIIDPLAKYIFLLRMQEINATLYYRFLVEYIEDTMPVVYTPTIGDICKDFGDLFWTTAMYLSFDDQGKISSVLDQCLKEPDIIVVTDGSRILGLGDLGVNGIAIPIGKLDLYCAAGGFHGNRTLPMILDVGTKNKTLLDSKFYLGKKHERIRGEKFFNFLDEFMESVYQKWPNVLVQFEDFSNDVCFEMLERYKEKYLCFNDDIQGTGAVLLAGFINAMKLAKFPLLDNKILFLGAGAAAIGCADMLTMYLMEEGKCSKEEAENKIYLVDSRGLVVTARAKIESHKLEYARKDIQEENIYLLEVVKQVKPTVIVGLSGQGGAFNKEIIQEMSKHVERPIVFALSNPTPKSECTATEVYKWSDGKCIFASGSPFDPVEYKGKKYVPGQGNNMYIFPGLGLGAIISKSKSISNGMIAAAAKALADFTRKEHLESGLIYPPISEIREISAFIATAVCEQSAKEGLSRLESIPKDRESWYKKVKEFMWLPKYEDYK